MTRLITDLINMSFWVVGWLILIGIAISGLAFGVAVFCSIWDKIQKELWR